VVKIDFRKIIGFGKGGYVVSLPRGWINKNRLKKGDLLAIDEGSGVLIFSVNSEEEKKEEKSTTIDASGKKLERLKAEIVSAYLNNYTTIEIVSKKILTNAVEIKEILRNLAGLEIMEQTSTRLVAKDLISINEISIEGIIRRMDIIIRGMIDDCAKCIEGEDHYESIYQRDTDVNRLFYLATRVIKNGLKNPRISKILNRDPHQLNSDHLIVIRLEKIADRQKRIARHLRGINLSKETVDELGQLYNDVKKSYLEVMKAYYTHNRDLAFDIELRNKQVIKDCIEFLDRNSGCYLENCYLVDMLKKDKGKKGVGTKEWVMELIEKNKNKKEILLNRCWIEMIKSKDKKEQKKFRVNRCIQVTKIVNNLKAMATSVRYIARTVIENE
jgi:phosphate transport system protein